MSESSTSRGLVTTIGQSLTAVQSAGESPVKATGGTWEFVFSQQQPDKLKIKVEVALSTPLTLTLTLTSDLSTEGVAQLYQWLKQQFPSG